MTGKMKWVIILFILVLLGSPSPTESQQTEEKEEQPTMKAVVVVKSGEQLTLSGIFSESYLDCDWGRFRLQIPISRMKSFEYTGEEEKKEADETVVIYKADITLIDGRKLECSFKERSAFLGDWDFGKYEVKWEYVKSAQFSDHPTEESVKPVGMIVDMAGQSIELSSVPKVGSPSYPSLDHVMWEIYGEENVSDIRACIALPNGAGAVLFPAYQIAQIKSIPGKLQVTMHDGEVFTMPMSDEKRFRVEGRSALGSYDIDLEDIKELTLKNIPQIQGEATRIPGIKGTFIDLGNSSHLLSEVQFYYYRSVYGIWIGSRPSEHPSRTDEIWVELEPSGSVATIDLIRLEELAVDNDSLRLVAKSGAVTEGRIHDPSDDGYDREDEGFIGRVLLNGNITAWMYIPIESIKHAKFE